jgi:pimeloyl-ACP methyl ester carboxylesterase
VSSQPPIVLVHGWAGSFRRTWGDTPLLPLLEDAGREVIGVDLLGHGEAPKPHDPAAYADLTLRVIDALPDGPVCAVGFSMGSLTLLQLACRQPDRFERLVISGVGEQVLGARNDSGNRVAEIIRGGGDPADTAMQALARHAFEPGNDPEALACCMQRPAPPDPISYDRIGAITATTLVAIGDNDFAGPADKLAAAFPDGRLKVLKNTDHFATPESFEFIDAVLDFLEAAPA